MPDFGIATLSLGTATTHPLEPRLKAATRYGYKYIDLFDECWAGYLAEHNLPSDPESRWKATESNLSVARKLGNLVTSLGLKIACTQPLREIEGLLDPTERKAAFDRVQARFPFMRAFKTDLAFMCANIRTDASTTDDLETVANDLAELGDLAREYSLADGGPLLKIGYEGLSWARRNTWKSTWEVVQKVNRENVGLVVDAFNILAVEFADPYQPNGTGRVHGDFDTAMAVVKESMKDLVKSVPGERIFFYQVADAEIVDPKTFKRPEDPSVPALLPWSRGYRLFPCEREKGGYMPVEVVTAAVLATGYQGPLSLEVFNRFLSVGGESVVEEHAKRGIVGLKKLVEEVQRVDLFPGRKGKL
ncbi:xylose isomerase-like protein [Aspergillus granulosus]|uniref:Xylose isomerase-like protein n=1 Tax=Aspergillus granulosus TaxID=176169 RepID=A0ABR4HB07_9EURO